MISPLSLTITLISDIVIVSPRWRPKPICVVGMETENTSEKRAGYKGLPTNRWDDSPAPKLKGVANGKVHPLRKTLQEKEA